MGLLYCLLVVWVDCSLLLFYCCLVWLCCVLLVVRVLLLFLVGFNVACLCLIVCLGCLLVAFDWLVSFRGVVCLVLGVVAVVLFDLLDLIVS